MTRWAVGAVLALCGCSGAGPSGLVIEGVLVPDDTCAVSIDRPLLGTGTLDVVDVPATVRPAGVRYAAPLRMASYLADPHTPALGVPVEDPPRGVTLEQIEVELRDASGLPLALGGLPNPYVVPTGARVPYAASGTPGRAVAGSVPIPAGYAAALATAEIRTVAAALTGVAVDEEGTTIRSNTYVFPLAICVGCLFTCGSPIARIACEPGQDDVTSSCP